MDRTSFCLAKEFGVQPVSGRAEDFSWELQDQIVGYTPVVEWRRIKDTKRL